MQPRRCAPRRRPSPPPPRSVAEVTSTPCAGSSTASASGRVGSSQRRWRPTSYSRPSTRSTASQSTKSGSAGPPIRAEQRDPRRQRLAPPGEAADRALDPRPRLARRASRARPRAPPRAAVPSAASGRCSASSASTRRRRRRDQRAVGLGQLGLEPVARLLRLGARVDRAAHRGEQRLDRAERRALGEPLQPAVATAAPAPPRPPPRAPARRPRHRRRRPSAAPRARAAARATCLPGPTIQRRSSIASCPVSAAAKVESAASNR